MPETFSPKFIITNSILSGLTQIDRARGFLEAASLSADWVREMSHRAFILEAHHTTHIEGTQLTLEQSERLLAGKTVKKADSDDVRELLNYRNAFDYVSKHVEDGKPITRKVILEIHRLLVEGVRGGKASPGKFRTKQNYICNVATGQVIYTPPAAKEVPSLMAELLGWLNQDSGIHPVLVSGIGQFQFVHIHPFLDGNGRTSRLLSTLCLYRAGYDFKKLFTLSEHYDKNRFAFYQAIQGVRDNNIDMTGWLEYFVDGLSTQLLEVRGRGEMAIRRDLLIAEYGLSERQGKAVGHILEHGIINIKDFEAMYPEVNRRTLQRDLKSIVEIGLLVAEGATSNLFYRLKPKK